ncbi:MAG: cytochrome c biogenesis protein CcsA [Planctomycetota bacterium]|nr:cytochrome c biogenesis protein CcsA [Planctomycetota bacterium]
MKNLIRILTVAIPLLALIGAASAQGQAPFQRGAPWSARTLELAEHLPVQDGGRIKPLSTYAAFTLLRLNGRRSVTTPAEEKLTPTEWLLDVLFVPAQAADYPVFMVSDMQAVEAIGVSVADKKKRDRYSMNELRPAVRKLFELARDYEQIEEKARSTVQNQVFGLATNVDSYLRLETHFDYARQDLDVSESAGLRRVFGADRARFSQVLAQMPALAALQRESRGDPARAADSKALDKLLQSANELTSGTESLALIPATGTLAAEPEWHSPADLFAHAFDQGGLAQPYIDELAAFEDTARNAGDPARFEQALEALHAKTVAAATVRGEYAKIGLEIGYYKADYITRSLAIFVLGFLLAAALWLFPRIKLLYWGANAAVAVATGLLIVAIVVRCMIRERPPVSTLYETVLFVTAVGAVLALVMERINRQRMGLSAAAILGVIGLFVANGYETLDKRDTMPQLVAVLDTNFWLATHVTAITIGYSAGMLAALLASVFLVSRLFGIKKGDPAYFKNLTRMTYGTLAFGLIFSVVGTILGGIWANESWGRFWGWDPKENGALLICLAQIFILHARMGGYVRDFGINMLAAFGGTVVGFSWFGVNLLGVGLHSYGFTSGIHTALWGYYLGQWGLMALAGGQYWIERVRADAARQALESQGRGATAPQVQ